MGVFIVVEGPEGAGKSTLVRWLAARLVAEGLPAMAVRQPGGTPVAEAARKGGLKVPPAVAPVPELFLLLAGRAELGLRAVGSGRAWCTSMRHSPRSPCRTPRGARSWR